METGQVRVFDWEDARRTYIGGMCWIVGPGTSNGINWPSVRRDFIIACNKAVERFVGQPEEYDNLWWLWQGVKVYDIEKAILKSKWQRWAMVTSKENVPHIERSDCQPTNVLAYPDWGFRHRMTSLEVALRTAQWLGFRRFIITGYSMRDAVLAKKIDRLGSRNIDAHLFDYSKIYCLGKSACKNVASIKATTALELRGVARDRLG